MRPPPLNLPLLLFNTETIRPMSIKIKVSLPLGIEEKTTGFKIIILLLTE